MDETTMRQAYMEAIELKNQGFDQEVIYARLEKKGIPENAAREVATNVMKQQVRERSKQVEEVKSLAVIKIGISLLAALVSWIFVPNIAIIPIGFIIGGILTVLLTKN